MHGKNSNNFGLPIADFGFGTLDFEFWTLILNK